MVKPKKKCLHSNCDKRFKSGVKKHCVAIHDCDGTYFNCPNERAKGLQIIADPADKRLIEALTADGKLSGKIICPHKSCHRWISDVSKHLNAFKHDPCRKSLKCELCGLQKDSHAEKLFIKKYISNNKSKVINNSSSSSSNNNNSNNNSKYSSDSNSDSDSDSNSSTDSDSDSDSSNGEDDSSDKEIVKKGEAVEKEEEEEESDDSEEDDYEDDEEDSDGSDFESKFIEMHLPPGCKFNKNILRCLHKECGWVSHGQVKNLKYHCKKLHQCQGKIYNCPNCRYQTKGSLRRYKTRYKNTMMRNVNNSSSLSSSSSSKTNNSNNNSINSNSNSGKNKQPTTQTSTQHHHQTLPSNHTVQPPTQIRAVQSKSSASTHPSQVRPMQLKISAAPLPSTTNKPRASKPVLTTTDGSSSDQSSSEESMSDESSSSSSSSSSEESSSADDSTEVEDINNNNNNNNNNTEYKFSMDSNFRLKRKLISSPSSPTTKISRLKHKCLHINCQETYEPSDIKNHLSQIHDCTPEKFCNGCYLSTFFQLYQNNEPVIK
ncbi:hypothetical protein PPL_00546 [Heterostelium album PN500]|uniref:Uncharacterized protein n=1 Tax=Heterostelium pallidum (strain ATCC 26659 / Pp 5 / PN500) TaxID=670386 RepID=D3AWR8_HETP5|nr:hypothetical protein PPL_00546 [Heterostelium album PN500]EFA86741.1 hypothetical protein PPL_00546 [Heterostelium album PN500]|eukprot:XP_020438845.1 hypothetical protein PPL_00546 [Heterostelium album PN500]